MRKQDYPEGHLIMDGKNTMILDTITEDLKRSSLSWDDVKSLGWRVLHNADELKETVGFTRYKGHDLMQVTGAILAIPYPGTNFVRVKLYPAIEGAKYLQPKGTPPRPYILPEVAELRDKPHKPIVFTEGEKKTVCLNKYGYHAIGLPGVWMFKDGNQGETFVMDLEAWEWENRAVMICFDSDAIYNVQVIKAEIELALNLYARGAKVSIARIPQPTPTQKYGVDDYISEKGSEAFKKVYDEAKPIFEAYPDSYYKEIIKAISMLYRQGTLLAGEVERATTLLAKHWHIRKSIIEKDLDLDAQKEEKPGIVEELEPYTGDVKGGELADQVKEILKKHVYLPSEHYYTAVTLWIFLTYLYDKVDILPMLLLTSPVYRCGKTTLLTTLEGLCNKASMASNISPAAVYRFIEKYQPTLLLDEADTGLAENDELRGIINAGHTKRTAFVIRTGDKTTGFEPERFNTFCPKAVAMIGRPAKTWIDRSIRIKMERKTKDIHIERKPQDFFEQMEPVRQKILKWSISTSLVNLPEDLFNLSNDRAVDNWRPLAAIAGSLDEEWLNKAMDAMDFIEQTNGEDDDLKIELLQDIRDCFNERGDKIFSRDLVNYLLGLEGKPWADLKQGKGITSNALAKMLKSFGIKPKTIRRGNERLKGYDARDFKKAFSRYIPPSQNVTPCQTSNNGEHRAFQNVTPKNDVTFEKRRKPASNLECHDVTDQKGGYTEEEEFLKDVEGKTYPIVTEEDGTKGVVI